jgi:hypothetical protein
MPIPPNDAAWPPTNVRPLYEKLAEWAAWYSGDPSRIIDVYRSSSTASGGTIPWWRFWRRASQGAVDGSQRALLHVPVASDLAAVSAALLFGEPPRFRIKEAHENDDFEPVATNPETNGRSKSDGPAEKTEARMLEVIARGGMLSRLVEAAESAAAIGGVYIYPAWDKDLFDFPIMAIAQADMALPEFKWGFLTAVTFHRVLETNQDEVFRLVERHEVEGTGDSRRAVVLNAVFRGTESGLGQQVELSAFDYTRNLQPRIELPFQELDVQYIPNIRPNRLWRATGHGVADIQGSETLLDAVDETFASWMRDVRLAKARLIVPRDYLRQDPDTSNPNSATFDIDQEIYTSMEMEPTMNSDARSMMAAQFEIRYLEHRSTARELIERVVSNAGYSPASLGQPGDSAGMSRTGAALRVSEHKTVLTQRRKAAHWTPALSMFTRHLLLVDKEFFGSAIIDDVHPMVEMSDSVIDQPLELAQTALAMKSAESASTETRVRILHKDWSDAEIEAEVSRIHDEMMQQAAMGGTFGGGGATPSGFGDPEKSSAATGNFPITSQKKGRQTSPPPTPPPYAKQVR